MACYCVSPCTCTTVVDTETVYTSILSIYSKYRYTEIQLSVRDVPQPLPLPLPLPLRRRRRRFHFELLSPHDFGSLGSYLRGTTLLRTVAHGSLCSSSLLCRHPGWRVWREPLIHKIRYYSRSLARALRAGPVVWPFLHLPMAAVEYLQLRRTGINSSENPVPNPVLIGHLHAGEGGDGRCLCVALAAGLGLDCQTWVAPAEGSPPPLPRPGYRRVAAY